MEYKKYYKSPVGFLEIIADNKNILAINFVKNKQADKSNALITKCVVQLREYFQGQRKKFDLPIKLAGTAWQNKVYLALSQIPYGTVISYKDLAEMSDNPQASRAIGQAVNKNKVPIIIPCHRVMGSSGKLAGYAGGLWRKKQLLRQEKGF